MRIRELQELCRECLQDEDIDISRVWARGPRKGYNVEVIGYEIDHYGKLILILGDRE